MAVNDPVPGGATILGSGLGRDSALATGGEQSEGASGKWVAHWKMVSIMRPVWETVGETNQLGREFPELTYTDDDAAGLIADMRAAMDAL